MGPRISTAQELNQHWQLAMEQPQEYWSDRASHYQWMKPWDEVCSGDFHDLAIKWFAGAELNITVNCLDRHLAGRGDQIAIHWEPNDPRDQTLTYTYRQLHEQVCRMANVLKDCGIQKGDRVCFYMSMVPELLIGVLACARIGAVHSVVFGGFSAHALAGRIQDCEAAMVITCDEAYRGQKTIPLKSITDEALQSCPSVTKVLVKKRTGAQVPMGTKDLDLDSLMQEASPQCEPQAMDAEDPLFILYTSGSTGSPKGLLHTTAGYMVWAGETFKHVFQMQENDCYWCSADIGWITGHSYLTYGPLLNGVTSVMFEGVPTFPDAGRFWQVIDKYQVTHFYTAPTAIRALQACDQHFVTDADLGSLKVLGTVGEPINTEAWQWYHRMVGKERCPIVDTWWQTETGGIMISSLAGVTPSIPTFATKPLPGSSPILVDHEGKACTGQGNLCLEKPWPGMARTIWGDHERYRQTYFTAFPGRYFTGDGAKQDEQGNFRITGRVDDVINVSGHRIGTAEVENALNEHTHIVESAVVGYPHPIKGQGIFAYVICQQPDLATLQLKSDADQLINKIIGPIAKPDQLLVVSGLPKTRSGKIMRRILRKIACGEHDQLGDVSTLLNPEVVEELKQKAQAVL